MDLSRYNHERRARDIADRAMDEAIYSPTERVTISIANLDSDAMGAILHIKHHQEKGQALPVFFDQSLALLKLYAPTFGMLESIP
jgi:hypothetical protein